MPFKEGHPLTDPRVEPTLHVLRDLTDDMRAILEPLQLRPRRCGPNGLFTLFAMVSVLHDDSGCFAIVRCELFFVAARNEARRMVGTHFSAE